MATMKTANEQALESVIAQEIIVAIENGMTLEEILNALNSLRALTIELQEELNDGSGNRVTLERN